MSIVNYQLRRMLENPYEPPQESGTPSDVSGGDFKRLALGALFVVQFALIFGFPWLEAHGRFIGWSPMAVASIGAMAFFWILGLFFMAVVWRSWIIAIVQVFVFLSYLVFVIFLM